MVQCSSIGERKSRNPPSANPENYHLRGLWVARACLCTPVARILKSAIDLLTPYWMATSLELSPRLTA